MSSLNPRLKQAYAISKRIPTAKNKRLVILAWCKAVKKAIG